MVTKYWFGGNISNRDGSGGYPALQSLGRTRLDSSWICCLLNVPALERYLSDPQLTEINHNW
jgi:hypothetical protein